MKFSLSFSEVLIALVVLSGIGVAVWQGFGHNESARTASPPVVRVPTLSARATNGRHAFDANCAQCHGLSGSGTDKGPPLVHDIYNPRHHRDEAFRYAVRQGVRQHHWPFGDMPAQPQISDAQIVDLVHYMREPQQPNGIVYRPHQM